MKKKLMLVMLMIEMPHLVRENHMSRMINGIVIMIATMIAVMIVTMIMVMEMVIKMKNLNAEIVVTNSLSLLVNRNSMLRRVLITSL